MARNRKSWSEKLADGAPHQVKRLHIDIAGMKAGQTMLVPSARMIDAAIRELKAGEIIDARALRSRLAARHGAEVCCPITTGILLRIVAEAALEAEARRAGPDALLAGDRRGEPARGQGFVRARPCGRTPAGRARRLTRPVWINGPA